MREMHGWPAVGRIDFDAVFVNLQADDVATTRAAVEAVLDPNGSRHYHAEYRIHDAAGRLRWIEARGGGYTDARGERVVGTALDVTARKKGDLAQQGLLDALAAQPFLQVCVLEGPRHIVTMANTEYAPTWRAAAISSACPCSTRSPSWPVRGSTP